MVPRQVGDKTFIFLSAKIFCISIYKFSDEKLEIVHSYKLAGTQQILWLRLIEKGDGFGEN